MTRDAGTGGQEGQSQRCPYCLDDLTSSLVNKDALKIQLDDLPTILGLYNIDQKTRITEMTKISTITDIFNAMPSAKIRCPEVHKFIMLYYPVPLASASCKRTLIQLYASLKNVAEIQLWSD